LWSIVNRKCTTAAMLAAAPARATRAVIQRESRRDIEAPVLSMTIRTGPLPCH
jgi:hypothetical protein